MKFELSFLEDPEVVAVGTLPPTSDHKWYASLEELQARDSSYEQSLDGAWKLFYAANPAQSPKDFMEPNYDATTWDEIDVPSHIQLRGYDAPQYVNVQYPWDGHADISPPDIPQEFNPTASYLKSFVMDRAPQAGERVTVSFAGAESALAVWLNGQFIGYSEDSFTPAVFDVTDFLLEGENVLAAQVFKWCSGSWLEDQDFFRFSGLFRSVTLRTWPKAHIVDVRVGVDLDEDLRSALVRAQVEVQGNGQVEAVLAGQPMQEVEEGIFSLRVNDPRLWSAEDPHLYELLFIVRDGAGAITECVPQSVGVRRFAIEGGLLKINGQRVVFKGVNRHEFGSNGRVFTEEETHEDMRLMKEIGINAIRTSHYPNNSFFYDLADQYGFYVIDEMNLESHGLWDEIRFGPRSVEDAVPGDDPRWLPALLGRAANMYQRDKNHPSIVMWSCGNESFGGKDILAVADYFREVDSRPVHYEGVAWDTRYPETTDVASQMYTPAHEVEEYLRTHRDKPFILCEYAHAMGNSFGAVDRYVELAYKDPLFQGGFIWDFADQAVALTDHFGAEYLGYGGDHDDVPNDGEFCGNGIFFLDRTPTPRIQEVRYLYQPLKLEVTDHSVRITNRYNFTNTDALTGKVTLKKEGELLASAALDTDVPPGQTKEYNLPLQPRTAPGEYTFDIEFARKEAMLGLPEGHVVATGQSVFEVGPPTPAGREISDPPEVVDGIHNIGVHGKHFSVIFSRLYGGMQGYLLEVGDKRMQLLDGIPMPNFWHAPTSNERGWGAPFEDGQWLLASRYAKYSQSPTNPSVALVDDAVTVTYRYTLPTAPSSKATVSYRVDGEGRVDVTLNVFPGEGLSDLPEVGMLFKVDRRLDMLTWYGEGPAESYVDRRSGAHVGVYTQPVAEQLTPYLRPQEAGSHSGVRWAQVFSGDGFALRFESSTPMEFSALPWSPFEIENATHHNQLPPVHHTYLRPALARRGVGGDDTWGARPHEDFLISADETLEFRFSFQGVPHSDISK